MSFKNLCVSSLFELKAFLLPSILVVAGCVTQGSDTQVRRSLFGPLPTTAFRMSPAAETQQENSNVLPRDNQNATELTKSPNSLIKIEGNIWRTGVDASQVYKMISRLLAQNYIVANADGKNLSISTDWDKFFIEGRLFRNRISVSVFPVGPRQTELVVKNHVEYFPGNPNSQIELASSNWLPSPDITDEVTRIIENVGKQTAMYQNQSDVLR